MAKKHSLQNVTIIPTSMANEAGRILPRAELQQLSFLDKMNNADREEVVNDMHRAAGAKLMMKAGALALGQAINNIYNRCEAYSGTFNRCMAALGIGLRQSYRFKDTYTNAAQTFYNNENLLKAAMVRELDVLSYDKERPLGKYTEVVRLLPPPRNADYSESIRWVEQVIKTQKERKKAIAAGDIEPEPISSSDDVQRDPEFLQMQNFRGIKNAVKHVPKRQRMRWFEKLVGMGMTELGISSPMTFQPEAVPEHFRQGPGRPPINPRAVHEAVA